MTQAAYLRVYLSSETVDAAGGLPPPPHRLEGGPRRLRVTDYGLLAESLSDDALIAVWGGAEFVCPRTPRVRMLEGVLAFHHAYREMGGDAVIPESVARRAATELRGLVEGVPLAALLHPHVAMARAAALVHHVRAVTARVGRDHRRAR